MSRARLVFFLVLSFGFQLYLVIIHLLHEFIHITGKCSESGVLYETWIEGRIMSYLFVYLFIINF